MVFSQKPYVAVFQAFKETAYFCNIFQQIFFVLNFGNLKGQKASFCTDFCLTVQVELLLMAFWHFSRAEFSLFT